MVRLTLLPYASLLLTSCLCHANPTPLQTGTPKLANENVVFFVRDKSGGARDITITLITKTGALIKKRITKAYSAPGHRPPACGSAGNASFYVSADWYIWFSGRSCPYPTTVSEAGSLGVEAGKCVAVEVSNIWACPLVPKESE